MRLDHIAYRVKDRYRTAKFFTDTLKYTLDTEFQIEFDDESKADCIAMTPPEVRCTDPADWTNISMHGEPWDEDRRIEAEYHAAPEIFISDGPPGSIVGDWVTDRGDIGGVHHMAYQVIDVAATMKEWKNAGYAEFLSEEPLTCPGLVQVFTKPSELTGIIYELISRTDKGFCEDNVKALMLSTVEKPNNGPIIQ